MASIVQSTRLVDGESSLMVRGLHIPQSQKLEVFVKWFENEPVFRLASVETSGVGAVTRIGDLHDTHQDPSAARPTGGHQHPSPATRGEPGHLRGHQGRSATRGHHRRQATRGEQHGIIGTHMI